MTAPSVIVQPTVPTGTPRDSVRTSSIVASPVGRASEGQAVSAKRPLSLAVNARTVLAASGFIMLGYVVLHLGGNLLAFAGSATFNAYARLLRELGSPLVGAGALVMLVRAVLASALVAHIAAHLWILLRPQAGTSSGAYVPTPPGYAAFPLPIMIPTGGAIFVFVTLHLAQLTFGATVPGFDPADPYHNLITALRSWPVALVYLAAAVAVGVHLLVGVWSGMRSLRLIRPRTEGLARILAPAVALLTALGLASVPVAVLLGILS